MGLLAPYLNVQTVDAFFRQFEKEVDPDVQVFMIWDQAGNLVTSIPEWFVVYDVEEDGDILVYASNVPEPALFFVPSQNPSPENPWTPLPLSRIIPLKSNR